MKICPSCGKQCDDSSAFCGFCGFPLKDVPSVGQTAPQQDVNTQPQQNHPQPQQQPNYQNNQNTQNNQTNSNYNNNQQQYNNYQPNNQQYGGYQQQDLKTDGYSIAALVLGILGVVFVCCYGIGIVPGILAIIFGVIGKKRCLEANGNLKGLTFAKAGFIMGLIVSILAAIIIILIIVGLAAAIPFMNDFSDEFSREFSKNYHSYSNYGMIKSFLTMLK